MVLTNEISYGWNRIMAESEKIIDSANSNDAISIKKALKKMVPEYKQDDLDINLNSNKSMKRTHI